MYVQQVGKKFDSCCVHNMMFRPSIKQPILIGQLAPAV